MKQVIDFSKILSFLFLLVMGSQLQAQDKAVWTSGFGEVWTSGSGECWRAGFPGSPTDCGGELAPEPEADISGKFWPDDSDFDGVVDGRDRCLFTPEGVAVDSNGCALDEDNDGIPDYLDECLGTPAGTQVNLGGCPVVLLSMNNITFETNSARLTDADKRVLDSAVPKINASSSSVIEVVGHTDSRGTDSYNQALSERRARAVMDHLVNAGVAANRLFASGRGEAEPVASNDTEAGRQQNRRVEILAK